MKKAYGTVLLPNVGDAAEINERVRTVLGTNSPIELTLDKPRVLRIRDVRVTQGVMSVKLKDVTDKAIVILALPYTTGARAQAQITTFDDMEV